MRPWLAMWLLACPAFGAGPEESPLNEPIHLFRVGVLAEAPSDQYGKQPPYPPEAEVWLRLKEESLLRELAFDPNNGVLHRDLGIVYYTEQRYYEAVTELTQAVTIDPKDAITHNYLGITASRKGWQKAAQKELEAAIAADPKYADAWFNLAVVLATRQPPDKDYARSCYKKAVELGAEADASLEALIK